MKRLISNLFKKRNTAKEREAYEVKAMEDIYAKYFKIAMEQYDYSRSQAGEYAANRLSLVTRFSL